MKSGLAATLSATIADSPIVLGQVHSMLSQLDPSLVAQCDAIAAQGGPAERPNSSSSALANPLELAVLAVPKASAGIRGVQPDYSTPKAWEPGKRSRKSSEGGQPGMCQFPLSWLYCLKSAKADVGEMYASQCLCR